MDNQDKKKPKEHKTVEEYLVSKFFTCPKITTALYQIVAENPEIEEAITALMSCPEIEAIKAGLATLFLTNYSDGYRLMQLTEIANGGDVGAFLMQNPEVLSVLYESPLVAELFESMELGVLKALGLPSHESPSNSRLANECYLLALLIVDHPSFKEAMGNVEVDVNSSAEDNVVDG